MALRKLLAPLGKTYRESCGHRKYGLFYEDLFIETVTVQEVCVGVCWPCGVRLRVSAWGGSNPFFYRSCCRRSAGYPTMCCRPACAA